MIQSLFVNLPVTDLERTRRFFSELGLSFHPRFTNADGACLVLNEHISLMLLTRPFYQGFTKKPVGDPVSTSLHLLALSLGSREEVDEFHERALAAGATSSNPPKDSGFMYQRDFDDLDGHQWEIFWMDESQMPAGCG